jgi:hypothetical protein
MKNRSKHITLLLIPLLLFTTTLSAQISIDPLHYRHRIENSWMYMEDAQDIHSGVLPFIYHGGPSRFTSGKGQFLYYQPQQYGNEVRAPQAFRAFRVYPLADAGAAFETPSYDGTITAYTAGLGIGADLSTRRFFITGKLMPYLNDGGFVSDSIQQRFNMDLGTTRAITGNLFSRNELLIAFRANKFFTFLGGYGKNFFGEGYRSLLLSDNASNYPFLKLETTFGSIKYVNLYNIWNDNTANPSDKSFDRMKFSAMHYLSWNVTREFNLSIFEAVVWQNRDTIAHRGFDINYLNPVVFYRPVEYGMGSADNVLLGANLSYKFTKNHCAYTQVILDEFLLSKIKDGSHWWGNKWGIQLGYKSNRFLMDDLYFQTEFNVVRPFTYSHKYSTQNYGHLNASVTHPIGANFYEVLNILSYKKEKHRITNKITYACYGIDTDTINYGQNIFNSYSDRNGDNGHLIMQGLRTNVLNEQLIFETPLLEKIDLYFHITYNYRMHFTPGETIHHHFVFVGLRSRIWNVYDDI